MSKAAFEHLQAVVFDWAGTVVDHGCLAPAIVFQEIFRQSGVEISLDEARGPMGMSKREHIATVAAQPRVAEAWREAHGSTASEADVDAMYAEFLPLQKSTLSEYSHVIEGAAEAIAELRSRGLKIGSSTGYTRELMEVVSPLAKQQGYQPDNVLCADDVPCGRPAPWLLFESARRMNTFPMWRIVKVDDTAPGMAAAVNAGAWAVGVTRTGNGVGLSQEDVAALSDEQRQRRVEDAGEKLRAAGAQFLVESVADIGPLLDDIERRVAAGERPKS